jgi:glycerate kinase
VTSTRGTGELLLEAATSGAGRVVIGIGGSATNDGGSGMARAIGFRLIDRDGHDLPEGGAALARLHRIEGQVDPRLVRVRIEVASDVTNPLLGPQGASAVFGPQKGATPEMVAELDAALARYADVVERFVGRDVRNVPGAGAAGGLGAGLLAFADAKLRSGAGIVMAATHFDERAARADLIVTGEGRMDAQSAYGKLTGSVISTAQELGRPVAAVVGGIGGGADALFAMGLTSVQASSDGAASLEDAMRRGEELIADAAERLARTL